MNAHGYCALVGSGSPFRHASAALHTAALSGQTLARWPNAVLVIGAHCGRIVLPQGKGFILGNLFDRSGRSVDEVAPAIAASWVASGGKTLLATYWGAYLAFLETASGPLLLRDPSGLFPCYYALRDGYAAVASDLAWARLAGDLPGGVCWPEIHAQLQYFSRRTERTAIEGLTELLPGTALRLTAHGAATERLWSPYDFAQRWDRPLTFEEAAERFKRAAGTTIAAWAKRYPRPLVEISGGLDSSIVAAASASHAPGMHAVTFRGGEADLDESRYAEAVAAHLGVPLARELLDVTGVDLRRSAAQDLPRPTMRSFAQASDAQALRLAQTLGSDAFFAGTGGDSVLWYFNTAAPALDRLRVEGLGGFLKTVGDLAEICDVPWTTALSIAVKKRFERRPRPWPAAIDLLSSDARTPATVSAHPWWPPPPGTLPGVRSYVRAMIQVSDHLEYDLRARHAPVVAPLVSQPIIETCLQTPSWLACTGGVNRAVARAAFAGALPQSILERRTKGGFDSFAHGVLERNRAIAREMLSNGRLASEGLLDVRAIACCLADPAPIPPERSTRILRLVAVEAWIDSLRRHGIG